MAMTVKRRGAKAKARLTEELRGASPKKARAVEVKSFPIKSPGDMRTVKKRAVGINRISHQSMGTRTKAGKGAERNILMAPVIEDLMGLDMESLMDPDMGNPTPIATGLVMVAPVNRGNLLSSMFCVSQRN